MNQQVLRPVEPAVVQDEDARRSGGGLGYQRQEESRLIHLRRPEAQAFHYQVRPFRKPRGFELPRHQRRLLEWLFVHPPAAAEEDGNACQHQRPQMRSTFHGWTPIECHSIFPSSGLSNWWGGPPGQGALWARTPSSRIFRSEERR